MGTAHHHHPCEAARAPRFSAGPVTRAAKSHAATSRRGWTWVSWVARGRWNLCGGQGMAAASLAWVSHPPAAPTPWPELGCARHRTAPCWYAAAAGRRAHGRVATARDSGAGPGHQHCHAGAGAAAATTCCRRGWRGSYRRHQVAVVARTLAAAVASVLAGMSMPGRLTAHGLWRSHPSATLPCVVCRHRRPHHSRRHAGPPRTCESATGGAAAGLPAV